MTEILIKVRGSSSVEVPPEIGVVHAEVRSAGASPEVAMDRMRREIEKTRARLERLQSNGAVREFVMRQVHTSAGRDREVAGERPWREGQESVVVYRASVRLRAEFLDFAALVRWADQSVAGEGCVVNELVWRAGEESLLVAEREVRKEAVREAKLRAQAYADALDLGPVSARRIDEIEAGTAGTRVPMTATGEEMAAAVYWAPEMASRPDDLTICADVEAEFAVSSRSRAAT